MKIAIMGYSGSGKSYLTHYFSQKYNIPAMELDAVAFDKNWHRLDDADVLPKVRRFMEQESWILDGNYDSLLLDQRLKTADSIIIVKLPRLQCLWRALRRSKERAKQGYTNDINPRFLRFLLLDCRSRERQMFYRNIEKTYQNKTVVLRSQSQIDRYIGSIELSKRPAVS